MSITPAPSPLARGPQWQLDDTIVTRIAGELAREMYTVQEVLDRFSMDIDIFRDRVRCHPAFERAYLEAKTIWHGTGNTRERVALKAGMLFEDWLAEADSLFHDKHQPLSSKVELLKQMSKVAGFEQSDKQQSIAPGDRVVVEINLGAGVQPGSNAQPVAVTIDKIAPSIDLNAAPEPLPEWNTLPASPPPAPAGWVPPAPAVVPPTPVLDETILPATINVPVRVTSKQKLVPFKASR